MKWAIENWGVDRAGVIARVVAIPDEIERTYVVGKLSEAYTDETRPLCEALPGGLSRDRCLRLNARPHLSQHELHFSGQKRVAQASPAALPVNVIPIPTVQVPATECASSADRGACLDGEARQAAERGDPGRAVGICALQAQAVWADDCRFNASEAASTQPGAGGYAVAAALCSHLDNFRQECFWHATLALVGEVVSAPEGQEAAVAVQAAERVRAVWKATSPDGEAVARRHVGWFWSLFVSQLYERTDQPDGTPLATVPEEAWPQVRGALAIRMRQQGLLSGSLEQQMAAYDAALARRSVYTRREVGAPPRPLGSLGEPTTPHVVDFFGSARRPFSTDVRTDSVFCLIEAAAYIRPSDIALLHEAAAYPDAGVAEEARRLVGALAIPQPPEAP